MLINFSKEEAKEQIKLLKREIAALQQPLANAKVPVIIIFEGLSAAGKGSTIGEVICELDPRFYQVYSNVVSVNEANRKPFLWSYWNEIPKKGQIAIMDRSYINHLFHKKQNGEKNIEELADSINTFERELIDDGYLILKFYLKVDKDEQKKRLKELESDKSTAWRVSKSDFKANEKYDEINKSMNDILNATNTDYSRWNFVECNKRWQGLYSVLKIIKDNLEIAIKNGVSPTNLSLKNDFDVLEMPKLSDVSLSYVLDDETYKKELKSEKEKLQKLHGYIYQKKIPVILGFEGWDAAGKGGAIRRLSWALDPRGFDVVPIAAPSKEELSKHYLWRFWRELQKDGHITIFDRTWYGRVMVERIEGFTEETRWSKAYNEINEFEKELTDWGAIVIKFWVQIDKDEQLRRFTNRQNTPEKQYKITDEDWRNREKWDAYEGAIDEMIQKTSTKHAPWVIVEGNDKKYARLKVVRTVRVALEEKLKKLYDIEL